MANKYAESDYAALREKYGFADGQTPEETARAYDSYLKSQQAAKNAGRQQTSGSFSPDVQAYLDEYGRIAASGMSEVDYYADQRNKLQARIEEELKADMERKGINPRSPMGQQYANMYMSYALDASPEYQLANSMYNQAYTAQREKDLAAKTKAEQQKVADFSAAMQQYDPVTGLPLSELNTQSAIADAKNSANRVGSALSSATQGFRDRLKQDEEYNQNNPNQGWGSLSEWFNYGK